jgi:hypothetical protein
MSESEVVHDPVGHRFYVPTDEGEAFLEYAPVGADKLDYRRTFVSPELRNRGLAEKIVRVALAWAASEGKEVVPTCWYVAKILERRSKRS